MSLWPFGRYDSPTGDRYDLKVTDDGRVFLIHKTSTGELVGPTELKGDSDEQRITAGILTVDDIASHPLVLDETIKLALEKLAETRKRMRQP